MNAATEFSCTSVVRLLLDHGADPNWPEAGAPPQPEPTGYMPTQDTVLFDEIAHCHLLPLVDPAGHGGEEHPEQERVEHGGRVYTD